MGIQSRRIAVPDEIETPPSLPAGDNLGSNNQPVNEKYNTWNSKLLINSLLLAMIEKRYIYLICYLVNGIFGGLYNDDCKKNLPTK